MKGGDIMDKRSLLNPLFPGKESSLFPSTGREILLGRELHKITKLKGFMNPIVTPNMMRR